LSRKILCEEDHNLICFGRRFSFEDYIPHLEADHGYLLTALDDEMEMRETVIKINPVAGTPTQFASYGISRIGFQTILHLSGYQVLGLLNFQASDGFPVFWSRTDSLSSSMSRLSGI
jgi:hypothetical protein